MLNGFGGLLESFVRAEDTAKSLRGRDLWAKHLDNFATKWLILMEPLTGIEDILEDTKILIIDGLD